MLKYFNFLQLGIVYFNF